MPPGYEQKLTAIDLFSGAGGLTCGLKQAGFRVLTGVEINSLAARTYRANHPDAGLVEADIRTLSPHAVMESLNLERGSLGLLAGCPPCQGFSTLRTRRKAWSVEDSRNDLVHEFMIRTAIGVETASSFKKVTGYMIADRIAESPVINMRIEKLSEQDIFCSSWDGLLNNAKRQWQEFLNHIKQRAPKDERIDKL